MGKVDPKFRIGHFLPFISAAICPYSPPIVAKLLEPGDGMRGVCVRAIRIARPHRLSSANCQFINDVRHALW